MILNRTIAPPSKPVQEVNIVEAQTQYLSNGTPLHVIQAGKQPVVGIELIFKNAGIKHEPRAGVSFFTIKMLSEGTAHRSAFEISEYIDKFGAFLQLLPGVDYATVSLYCLSKHADALSSLLHELTTDASFPAEELAKLKTRQQQRLKVSNEKSSVVASKKLKSVLFGNTHPYGRTLQEEDINQVNQEDLTNFFATHLRSGLEIVVSGDAHQAVIQSIDRHFGQLSSHDQVLSPTAPIDTASEKQHLVEKPDNLQSSIRMGIPLFTKQHPDYSRFSVVNTLIGGYFGSRLMRNIREEKGLTYGISSAMVVHQEAGYFVIGTDVKKALTQLAIDEIYKEIEAIQTQPVGEVELNTVKNYMAGRLLSSVDTPFALAEKFKNIYLYGLGYDFYKNHLTAINAIDAEAIQHMASKYLTISDIKEVVVGNYQ